MQYEVNDLPKKRLVPIPKRPVSIAIAMKTAEGISVMCDSRTTFADGSMRDDAVKAHSIRFDDGNWIIVARVGIDEFSGQLIDIMLAQSKGQTFKDRWSGVELAREAIIELKNQIRQQYHGTVEELQRHFLELNFELLIAYYFEGKPHLFTVDFALGSWTPRTQDYFAIGCGKTLADFLLYKISTTRFSLSNAIWTSAYLIESVKSVDGRCGGPIHGGFVMAGNQKSVFGQFLAPNLEKTVAHVTKFLETQRLSWQRTVENEL